MPNGILYAPLAEDETGLVVGELDRWLGRTRPLFDSQRVGRAQLKVRKERSGEPQVVSCHENRKRSLGDRAWLGLDGGDPLLDAGAVIGIERRMRLHRRVGPG